MTEDRIYNLDEETIIQTQALLWSYQCVLENDDERRGIDMSGEVMRVKLVETIRHYQKLTGYVNQRPKNDKYNKL